MDWELLTDRQREILLLLANGFLVGEVARKQSTSTRRINMELRDIYNALKLRLGRRNPACALHKAWFFDEISLPEWATEGLFGEGRGKKGPG